MYLLAVPGVSHGTRDLLAAARGSSSTRGGAWALHWEHEVLATEPRKSQAVKVLLFRNSPCSNQHSLLKLWYCEYGPHMLIEKLISFIPTHIYLFMLINTVKYLTW